MTNRSFGQAVRDAVDGVGRTLREQPNFRIQIMLGALAVGAAVLMNFASWRWALLMLTIALVLGAELFNTALEHAVDHASSTEHPLARAAKHAGAGAVLVICLGALAVGVWLFGGAFWHF
jgi:diacylglycerol kinase